ncbi:MAG: hypothetical protein IBX40_11030 [Methanosarcinales archaeon]|nr:hypothetical protein [Methanosarcinales archaeon]
MFLNKFLKKEHISIHPPAGLITDITDLDEFKQRLGIRSRAKTLADLIKYLDTLPEQSWNVNKTFRSNSGKIRTVGIYDSFPTYEDATELFEQFGGGKYTILCISPRRMKVGYYEFEGEDRFPEEEEAPVRQKRLKLKYKPRDFKEALLLKRLEEGDEQLIRQITDAELSSQGILRNDGDMPVIQQQGVDLKEHFDKIEELKEEIHKRDMQIIEERFSKGGASGGWESFSRMLESSAGKEPGKEALMSWQFNFLDMIVMQILSL